MSNQLMKFQSPELGMSLSGTLYKGEPVFDAVEVAKALGYADPHQALKNHCKSLIRLNSVESTESGFGSRPKGIQLAREPDFYRLILRSQLPSAEKVQDWVCEDVLPAIRQTGSYSVLPIQPAHKEFSMNNDILSLARVVAEATASATMKAVMEVSGANFIASAPAQPALAEPITSATDTDLLYAAECDEDGYIAVTKLSWVTTFSDPSCRHLIEFAALPTRKTPGIRGLMVHKESFMSALSALIDESEPPAPGRKRWKHPGFGCFALRKDPKEIFGETE